MVKNAIGNRLELEADPPHPARHHRTAELNPVAGINPFLAIKRQTIGVFRDGDQGQERFRGHTGFDDMGRRLSLNDRFMARLTGVLGTVRDDHPEARRDHVKTFAYVFCDLHPVARPAAAGERLRFECHVDPFEMERERFARPRGSLAFRRLAIEFRLDRAQPGLDLIEGKVELIVIQPLRAATIARPFQRLEHRVQPRDPHLGIVIDRLQPGDLAGHRQHHRLERINVVREGRSCDRHRLNQTTKPAFLLGFSRSMIQLAAPIQAIAAAAAAAHEAASTPSRRRAPSAAPSSAGGPHLQAWASKNQLHPDAW